MRVSVYWKMFMFAFVHICVIPCMCMSCYKCLSVFIFLHHPHPNPPPCSCLYTVIPLSEGAATSVSISCKLTILSWSALVVPAIPFACTIPCLEQKPLQTIIFLWNTCITDKTCSICWTRTRQRELEPRSKNKNKKNETTLSREKIGQLTSENAMKDLSDTNSKSF